MNAEQRAANGLGKLLNLIKGVVEVQADLEKLGSLKAAIAEAQSRHDVIRAEENKASQGLADKIAAAEDEKFQASEAVRSSKIEADKIVRDSEARAAEIVATAEKAAKQLKDDARRELADAAETRRKLSEALVAVQKTT